MNTAQQEVARIRANVISAKSAENYRRSIIRFLEWLLINCQELATDDFRCAAYANNESQPSADCIKTFLARPNQTKPIKFDELTAELFMEWIISMRDKDGNYLSAGTYSTHRSALFNLYRTYSVAMPKSLSEGLVVHFKGLKRTTAKHAVETGKSLKKGKDPMPFSLYRQLGIAMLHLGDSDRLFAHTFMTVSWNLMCRSSNTVNVCYSHMEWREDALCIYFGHSKTDQTGDKPRDPRHVYANPIIPAICPILSLGLYWLSFPVTNADVQLFPGHNQYDRFRKCLKRTFTNNKVASLFTSFAIPESSIGTHSLRKGSATYCSSGSTSCPSASAISLRAGWTMGGMFDTYIRYQSAGDMHVGRMATGLPPHQAEFAILPPRFTDSAVAQAGVNAVFPELQNNLKHIAQYLLASIVYHSEFILKTVSESSRIRSCLLFTNPNLLLELKLHVKCELPHENSPIQVTGIPAYVAELLFQQQLRDALVNLVPTIRESSETTVTRIIHELEERAIGARTLTRDGLQEMIQACMDSYGVPTLIARINAMTDPSLRVAADSDQFGEFATSTSNNHQVGSGLVINNFNLPVGGPLIAWQHWILGNLSKRIRSYRLLHPCEIPTKNMRTRLSELHFLMNKIEKMAKTKRIWNDHMTLDETNRVFEECKSAISLPESYDSSRPNQLAWTTVAKKLRSKNHPGV